MTTTEINHKAWAQSAVGFIRDKGLEQEFTDWCGGWRCPVDDLRAIESDLREQASGSQDGYLLSVADRLRAILTVAVQK